MNILIADDDPVSVKMLETHLAAWGHTTLHASDGHRTAQMVASRSLDMVICSASLPGLDGPQLCRWMRRRPPSAYIYLMLTNDRKTGEKALPDLTIDADDTLAGPIDPDTLHARVAIGARIVNLERGLHRQIETISATRQQTMRMFTRMMAAADDGLRGHCRRTADLAVEMARRHPDVDDEMIPTIETAALLHDIGMVVVPTAVINKRRTEMVADESRQYRSHADLGARIVAEIESLKAAARLIGMHHEQYNGRGFPDGLSADQIPVEAQLISAASIYDNLCHRGRIAFDDIPENLQRMRGYQLSPEIVAMLLTINVARQHAFARRTDHEKLLDELVPGMVLAANVRMNTGAFVMAAGTELNAYRIDRLNHYHTNGTISEKVLIRKPSMGS
jgi:putative nucleotidyltransferase with HDIG domain